MSLKKIRLSKGFTLIELMIVVAIIGILAAIAIPKFADLVTKSKEASLKGTLGSVRSAVSIYYGDTEGIYPGNLFTALTSGNKYMPQIGSTSSLGVYNIPQAGNYNPGHSAGNASAASFVLQQVTGDDTVAATRPILYASTSSNQGGEVYINCSHRDTKGNVWTGF
jgi:prepilin-type N-terminal cleavage/methylation domain-containing protein